MGQSALAEGAVLDAAAQRLASRLHGATGATVSAAGNVVPSKSVVLQFKPYIYIYIYIEIGIKLDYLSIYLSMCTNIILNIHMFFDSPYNLRHYSNHILLN